MADTTDQLSLDASQLLGALANVQRAFEQYNTTIGKTADVTVKLNQTQEGIAGSFKQILEDGTKLVGTLAKTEQGWDAVTKSVTRQSEALKKQQQLQKEATERATKDVARMIELGGLKTGPLLPKNIPAEFQRQALTLQQQFRDAMATAPIGAFETRGMIDDLRKGLSDARPDLDQLQNALQRILDLERRIGQAQEKQAANTAAKAQAAQKAVQKALDEQSAALTASRLVGSEIGPVPPRFQRAVISAKTAVAREAAKFEGGGDAEARQLLEDLKRGAINPLPAYAKLQLALQGILDVQRRITEEQNKQPAGATAAARAAQIQANLTSAAAAADKFIGANIPIAGAVPSNLQSPLFAAQRRLAEAMAKDLANSGQIADEIFKNIQDGVNKTEVGIRGKIQAAMLQVLRVVQRIKDEQQKIADSNAPAPAAAVSTEQLGAFRQSIASTFPVPDAASIGSVQQFQNALNNLIQLAARGKIPFQDLRNLFQQLRQNPLGDFAGNDANLQKVQTAIRGVIIGYQAMKKSAEEAGEAGTRTNRSLLISFTELFRILEIQVVHRAFGNFVTGVQGSLAAAADLQIRISEIRTVSQAAGISFEEFATTIRQTSEAFRAPEIQVAEALYQGFSNQTIKTRNDLNILNETMRLSQITVSSAAQGMEAMSSVLNAYQLQAYEASRVTDVLFKAVELGRFRLQDISGHLGRVNVIAAQVGVRFEEVSALLANLTRNGVSASEAITQITSLFNALLRPTKEMTELMARYGQNTGIGFIQTQTFTGALRIMFDEAQRGAVGFENLIHNRRAFLGALGATQGGGTGGLEDTTQQLENARQTSEQASTIIAESAGARFKTELIKIKDFFESDIGNAFINTLEKMTAPFGGLSEVVKQVGDALKELVSVGLTFIKFLTEVITLGGTLSGNLGTIIKLYLGYKGAILAVQAAQSLINALTSTYASLQEQAAAKNAQQTAQIQLQNTALQANANATNANTVAVNQNNDARSAALKLQSDGVNALVGATTATTAVTNSQIAATAATNLWGAALKALPFIALFGLIANLVGAFDTLIARFSSTQQAIADMRIEEERLARQFVQEGKDADRRYQDQARAFENAVRTNSENAFHAIAALTSFSSKAVESQREVVKEVTNRFKEIASTVRHEMSKAISDTTKKIEELETITRESRRRILSFADRDASERFKVAFKEASRKPEIISGLQPLSYEQKQLQEFTRGGEEDVFRQQSVVLQQRLIQLGEDARRLEQAGDRQSLESARRKYEEIRKLTEQLWELQTERGRTINTEIAEDTARLTGGIVRTSFTVNLQELQTRLDAIRAREEQFERNVQTRAAQEEARLRTVRAEQQSAQDRINRALTEVQNFTVTDQRGALRPDFAGPGGLETFQRRYAELQRQLQAALADPRSGVSIETRTQLLVAFGQQRIALEQQIQRQITQNEINEVRIRFQRAQEELIRSQAEAQTLRRTAQNTQRESITTIGTQLRVMQQNVETGTPLVEGERTSQLVTNFARARQEAQTALREFEQSRGTERENDRMEILRRKIEEVSRIYREFVRHIYPTQNVPGLGETGPQVAGRQFDIETAGNNLRTASGQLEAAQAGITAAEQNLNRLRAQVFAINPALIEAGRALGAMGQVAAQQQPIFDNLASTLTRLATALERMNQRPAGAFVGPQLPPFVGPPAPPAAPTPLPLPPDAVPQQGSAAGGLLGTSFSSRGPDNMLIAARRGEFVVNPESTRQFYSQLVAINAGRMPRGYAQGGLISTTNVGDVSIHVDGSKSPDATARVVLNKLKREFRRGNGSFQ